VLVCAGAGMGVDSGLPDFRGPEGFWRAYPPYRDLGLRFEEIADPVHFAEDPELAWGFYGHRLELYRRTEPHTGFAVLREWATRWPTRVFTSNVDGQFQRAGFPDDAVAECHGSIHVLQCTAHCGRPPWSADDDTVVVDPETMRAQPPLPSCPSCGSLARPNILMFGDADWIPDRTARQLEAHRSWQRELRLDGIRPAVVEIGAGTAISDRPARGGDRRRGERCARADQRPRARDPARTGRRPRHPGRRHPDRHRRRARALTSS
jgi:NAD-dependent SIR2 family protein deacetylase